MAKQVVLGVSAQFQKDASCLDMQQCRGLTLKAVTRQQVTTQVALQNLGKSRDPRFGAQL